MRNIKKIRRGLWFFSAPTASAKQTPSARLHLLFQPKNSLNLLFKSLKQNRYFCRLI